MAILIADYISLLLPAVNFKEALFPPDSFTFGRNGLRHEVEKQ